jgi:hypothetical protein
MEIRDALLPAKMGARVGKMIDLLDKSGAGVELPRNYVKGVCFDSATNFQVSNNKTDLRGIRGLAKLTVRQED